MKARNKKSWQGPLVKMMTGARCASAELPLLPAGLKKRVLLAVATALRKAEKHLIAENQKDVRRARHERLSAAMVDRLTLTPARIREMAEGVRVVANLKDTIGQVLARWHRPNGLRISKVVVPIGVILIIYESRPNVTVECASLCFKSGNAAILRGGREAYHSNRALVALFEKVFKRFRLPAAMVNLVPTSDYAALDFLLGREAEINLVIPRGGEALIRKVVELSRIPVIKHYKGICHVYVDRKADLRKALAIAYNAKLQRPGVCNAMETLLVHRKIAAKFLPVLGKHLERGGCEIRGDRMTLKYIPSAKRAKPDDYGHEFLDKILAVKVVSDVLEAVGHIQRFSSAHTDAIVTEDRLAAEIFKARVDSSSVMVNASTRFSDGFQYGFGAEIGISTDKIHARGPMGLDGLTSYKYLVEGDGQVRT
ncbi:MAG: glutamate-5-semialdehyde dehydrogenase [Candidatus Omnitrophica bacterium]|nr:glutamate-5-semialdehyde dehydrogenase [Candidatus Omnitrophota bacterium]MDD5671388.1 glutamate-5-semialdehyde dehydrogenase [Candidatus Omnitrophota bacterium]